MKKAQIYIILVLLLGIISFSYASILRVMMFSECNLFLLLAKEEKILRILRNIDYETLNLTNFTVLQSNLEANFTQLTNWTYRYKIPIILKEEGARNHTNEIIAVNLTLPQATDNCSIEIYCENEKANYYIRNWTTADSGIRSTILFNFSLEANSTKHCSLYFQRWSKRGCEIKAPLVANATNVTAKALHWVELKIILMGIELKEERCEYFHRFAYPLVVK